jgi:hypothetical protein
MPRDHFDSGAQVGVSFGETRELAFLHAKSGTKVHERFKYISRHLPADSKVRSTFLKRMECCSALVATVRAAFHAELLLF